MHILNFINILLDVLLTYLIIVFNIIQFNLKYIFLQIS